MANGPQKPDHGGNFVMTPRRVTNSTAWRHLSLRARAVLQVIQDRHNGYNNGGIGISIHQIGEAIGDQNHGANGRALAELIELGFLECMTSADRHQMKSRLYRVTFISTGQGKSISPATHEYADWRPTPGQKRKFGGARTATESPVSIAVTATMQKVSVAVTASPPTESCGFEGDPCVAVTARYIGNQSVDHNFQSESFAKVGKSAPEHAGPELDDLRDWMKVALQQIGVGAQRALSQETGIPEPVLSKFKSGRSLPDHYRANLQMACGRRLPFIAWKELAA